MKTLLTNTSINVSIVIDTTASKAEQFRQVSANEKCDIGRTSFMNLLSGKATSSKGWSIKTEEVKPEVKVQKTTKVFGMDFKVSEISNTRGTRGGARKRRDMEQVFADARKGKHAKLIKTLESIGFKLCDVQKEQRWVCVNLPTVSEVSCKAPRLDISPLKNGGVNFSLYIDNRATGIKKSLKSGQVTPEAIIEMATHKDFIGAQA